MPVDRGNSSRNGGVEFSVFVHRIVLPAYELRNVWATTFHALSSWPRIFALFAELLAHSSGRSGGPFRCRRISWKKDVFSYFFTLFLIFHIFAILDIASTDRPGRVLGAVLHSAKISAQL